MRTIDTDANVQLQAGVSANYGGIKFDFDSGSYAFWNGLGPLVWNSVTFQGAGSLIEVEAITEKYGTEGTAVQVTLRSIADSALSSDVLASIEEEDYRNRPVTIYDLFIEPSTRELVWVRVKWRGRVSKVEHNERGDGTYELIGTLEPRTMGLSRTGAQMRSDIAHQAIWSGDKFFEHAAVTPTQPTYWGRKAPKTKTGEFQGVVG